MSQISVRFAVVPVGTLLLSLSSVAFSLSSVAFAQEAAEPGASDESGPSDAADEAADPTAEEGGDGVSDVDVPAEATAEEGSMFGYEMSDDSPAPQTAAADDPDRVFRAFSVYAEDQKRRRIAGAAGGVIIGGTTIAVGAVLKSTVDADPKPWYIVGGVVAGFSVLGLVMPSPAEQMAQHYRVDHPGHSMEDAARFEAKWASAAQRAKTGRALSGVINLVLGAGAAGAGGAIVGGAGTMSDNSRGTWGSILIATGAGFVAGGVTSFIVKSPVEISYEEYVAASSGASSSDQGIAVSLGLNGLGIGMTGSF